MAVNRQHKDTVFTDLFYTDQDAFICTEETGMTIKQGQPDRRIGNIVYYVNSGEQRVKLTDIGQFVYKDLNDKTGYYTNVEGLKN